MSSTHTLGYHPNPMPFPHPKACQDARLSGAACASPRLAVPPAAPRLVLPPFLTAPPPRRLTSLLHLPCPPCRYNSALIVRLVLTWFPNPPGALIGPLATICDPYLNLFRGIIPPIGGTLDLSPILAFFLLNVSVRLCDAHGPSRAFEHLNAYCGTCEEFPLAAAC